MKIFIYSYGVPTSDNPMHGIFAFDQAKALKSLGHEIYFIVLDLRSLRRRRKLFFNYYVKDSIDVCRLSVPLGRMPDRLHDFVDAFFSRIILKKAINTYGKPQIIHSHFLRQGYSIAKLFSKDEIRLFCTIHDSHLMSNISGNDRLKLDFIQLNSTLLTVSRGLSKELELSGISSDILNNMIDEEIFKHSKNRQYNTGDYALTAGALIARKGMEELINIWRDLPDSITTKLVILGDGPQRPRLKELIQDYGLEHRVELKGIFNRNQFAEYLDYAKYFVLASKKESFGVVYAESLMNGVPVIATNCGGPEDLINESNGILVEVDNHDGLLEAVIFMESNYSFYDSISISAAILNEFGSKAVALKLIKLYEAG